MSNYLLSAYELISREVESLYVHVPKFKNKQPQHDEWYRKHLYVLFTRPTARLVVNFDVKEDYDQIKKLVGSAKRHGAKLPVVSKTFRIPSTGVRVKCQSKLTLPQILLIQAVAPAPHLLASHGHLVDQAKRSFQIQVD